MCKEFCSFDQTKNAGRIYLVMAKKLCAIFIFLFSCLFIFSKPTFAIGPIAPIIMPTFASNAAIQSILKWNIPVMNKLDSGITAAAAGTPNSPDAINNSVVFSAGGVTRAILVGTGDNTPTLGGPHVDNSGVGNAAKMIGMLYVPPAMPQEYIADVMHTAGIATPAYAQGLGFSSLAPVLETWKVFRTIAYFFYVLIFLAIGFMIMFRQRIGSQTAVTVQQALPKLIVSLITVTFSYAIAGLMIELMYLFMFLILNVFVATTLGQTPLSNDATGGKQFTLQDFGTNSNIFTVAGIILNGPTLGSAGQSVGSIVTGVLGLNTSTGNTSNQVDILGSITGLAAAIVFAIALLFALFKLFFELLKTYIMIIIMIVTAPVTLMLGALPGSNAFTNWIKGLFFNLAVFPTVLVVMIMAFLLQTSISANGGFLPPYIGGSGTSGSVAPLLGLGVLLVMPEMVEKVKAMAPKGGIFDDLGNKAGAALKKGWSGGQLVDGLGFTDTRKAPLGGISGENLLRKGGITGVGVGSFLAGGAYNKTMTRGGSFFGGGGSAWMKATGYLGNRFNDARYKKNAPEKKTTP